MSIPQFSIQTTVKLPAMYDRWYPLDKIKSCVECWHDGDNIFAKFDGIVFEGDFPFRQFMKELTQLRSKQVVKDDTRLAKCKAFAEKIYGKDRFDNICDKNDAAGNQLYAIAIRNYEYGDGEYTDEDYSMAAAYYDDAQEYEKILMGWVTKDDDARKKRIHANQDTSVRECIPDEIYEWYESYQG